MWKEDNLQVPRLRAVHASTEPHAIACGKMIRDNMAKPEYWGFNGATRYRVWKVV